MANVHIPNMDGVEGQNKFSVVPAWGFDYDFWFNKRWAVGLHNDLILQQYKIVKEENHTVVERSYRSLCALQAFINLLSTSHSLVDWAKSLKKRKLRHVQAWPGIRIRIA